MSNVVRIGRSGSTNPEQATTRPVRSYRSPRSYVSLNGAAMMTIAAVALAIIGILYLIQTSQVAGLGYELSRLQQRHDELALENAQLGYEVARYESLETVHQVAIQQVGMTNLEDYQFIEVRRPESDNLSAPPMETTTTRTLWDRIVAAITGEGHSTAAENDVRRDGGTTP